MTTLNPRDWPRLSDWLDPHEGRRSPGEINREVFVHRKPRSAPLAWAAPGQLRSQTSHRSTCPGGVQWSSRRSGSDTNDYHRRF
jgi:hypothetical protein